MNYKIGMISLGCPKNQVDAELAAAGVPANLVRFSCGLENSQDLIEDIAQALEKI